MMKAILISLLLAVSVRNSLQEGNDANNDEWFTHMPHSSPSGTTDNETTVRTSPKMDQASSQFDCNFDSGFCGWTQDSTDYFDWTLNSGSTGSVNTGPSSDHTTGSGQYAYIETSNANVYGKNARLTSPYNQVVAGGTKCLRFYYHMYGATMGTFNIYVSKVGDPLGSPIFQRYGNRGNYWDIGQVDITRGDTDPFVVTFEGIVGTSYTSDLAIDDVMISSGYCAQVTHECDFEDPNICGYSQETGSDDFDWLRKSANTPSLGTGPPNDHTLGTSAGYYMFIETSSPRVLGEEARLWSPASPVAGGHCIEFYYHMYGSAIGTLNVYIVETGEDVLQLLPSWSQSSDQGNQWYIDRFLAPTVNDYRIVFEGVAGSSFTSDIAIDDVRITNGSCLSQGDCDFEEDYCTWINDVTVDDFDWIRKQGTINGTGPPSDHTFGSSLGYYVYLDQTNQALGRTARMVSPHFNALTGTRGCVTFWYYLEGNDTGALTVAQERSGFPDDVTAWMLDSSQGASWNYGQVSVARDYDYRIVFIGEVGASTQGIIAVDDIIVTDNNCPAIPSSAVPQPTFPPPQTTAPDTVTTGMPVTTSILPSTTIAPVATGILPSTTIAPGASVSCGSMSMTAILDRTLLENNGDAGDVHFEDQSCTGYDYSGSQIAVTTRYDECNTQSEQTDAVITYSNVVTYFKPTGENGSLITRDFRLKIPVICAFNRRSLLGNNYKPTVGIVSFSEVGYGSFSLNLGRYTDEHFTTPPPDLDALVYLGQKLYFGVKLNASTDLTLLIDRCWATPDVYPANPMKYTFIKDGCGLDSTVEFHEEDASLKGFSIDAFTFIGEYHEVFLHCDIFVCEDNDPSSRCSQGCVSRARRAAGEARGSSSQPHTISNGPMSTQHARSMDTSRLANPVNIMLVAAAGFFITMVAMVTVRKLRSRGKPSKGYNRLETENENEA